MPVITLPDGSERRFDPPVSVADVAADIGPGLAKAAVAGRVDGRLVDTDFVINGDAKVAIVTPRDEEGIEIIRHSTAHLLAQAVKDLYPQAQVTIGPVIEDGFYYDFAFERPCTPEDLEAIEGRRLKLSYTHPHTQESLKNLIELYEAWNKPEEAEKWRLKLQAIGNTTQ